MSRESVNTQFLPELTDNFKEIWKQLYSACPWSNPFCSMTWLETSSSVLAPSSHSLVPVLIRNGSGDAIAAGLFEQFSDTRQKTNPRVLKLVDYNVQRIPPLLAADKSDFSAAWTAFLKAARKKYDRIDMFKLDSLDGYLFTASYRLSTQGIPYISSVFNTQPAIVIPVVSEDKSTVSAVRSGKTRKKIRWTMKKLEEECGPWHIEDISSLDETFQAALEQAESVYRSSWQYKDSKKIDHDRPELFLQFIEAYTKHSEPVRIRLLFCGSTPIAFDYILTEEHTAYIVFGSILEEYKSYGPGTILLADMLENYSAGCIIELGGGYLDYKIPWANTFFNTMKISVFGTSVKGRLLTVKHTLTRNLQSWNTALQRFDRTRERMEQRLYGLLKFTAHKSRNINYILQLPVIPEPAVHSEEPADSKQSISIKEITPKLFDLLAEFREASEPEALSGVSGLPGLSDLFSSRLENGAEGLLILENDIPAAYTWIITGTTLAEDSDNTKLSLGSTRAYIFDTYVHPGKRGLQLLPMLIYEVQQKCFQKNIHQCIVLIDQMNVPSLKAHMETGGTIIGTIIHTYKQRKTEHVVRSENNSFTLRTDSDNEAPAVIDISQLLNDE